MSAHSDKEDSGSRSGSESPPPRPAKPIAQSKLQAFSLGVHKKTPFQRHKEELEQKKKKESEEAAKVYADFVASFDNERNGGMGPAFVKSGATMLPAPASSNVFNRKQPYKPMPFVKAGQSVTPNPLATEPLDAVEDNTKEEEEKAKKLSKAQKKRNLDTFLEEIKREQEDREGRLKHARVGRGFGSSNAGSATNLTLQADRPGSHDVGDNTTTNLYLGNISPNVNEAMLCRDFAVFGPIASVKIMWPRTQEEKDRNHNSAFISFMKRPDAEKAIKAMDGKDLHGNLLRVCWGKPVPIPMKPIFALERSAGALPSGLPFNAQITTIGSGVVSKPRSEIQVVKPEDTQQLKLIHRTIERVLVHGQNFEAALIGREWNNPGYSFLTNNNTPEHVYYRWKLYSLLQGDSKHHWRSEPFQMFAEGPWWIPPEIPFDNHGEVDEIENSSDEEEREKQREHITKGNLSKVAKRRLEIMLRKINFQRGTVAKAMAFAINHSDAADEVIDIICKSMVSDGAPLSQKIARLYLVSDILHNSSVHVTNAWKYRSGFEMKLSEVFQHFNKIYRSIRARLKAEQVRRQICSIFAVWNNWIVFPEHRIAEYNSIFTQPGTEVAASEPVVEEEPANTPPEPQPDEAAFVQEEDTVDGEPMDEDLDGESMSDIDGEPLTDDEEADEVAEEAMQQPQKQEIEDMFS
ncbi:hypothetical protein INT43_001462 [Umbelopsis isabellina]|uniref:U2 snRNP-associated SURP motif-containing protein n=1 Tax=Mortierella isabellina TaxID=91625 RepID=A0A8H7PE40_MORIS|nr:hypothetical protein INT43_001462 [Umbelopsis isabellina]